MEILDAATGVTNSADVTSVPTETSMEFTEEMNSSNDDDSDADKDYRPDEDDGSSSDEEVIQLGKKRRENGELSHTNENPTDSPKDATNNNQSKKSRSRWQQSRPETWSRNIEKQKRKTGLPYKSRKGVLQKAKVPKPVDCTKCRYNCSSNLNNEDRNNICKAYWNLETYERQKDFILASVQSNEPKTRRPRQENSKQRMNSKSYFFEKKGDKFRVCQKFFCSTLCISNIPILTAFAGKDQYGNFSHPDKRGRKEPTNKTPEEDINRVKTHIESFPTVESHYTRKSTNRKYLDSKLNINVMYRLYKEVCIAEKVNSVSLITYKRVFGKHYNLSFFKPKKDQCETCTIYQNAPPEVKLTLEENYQQHQLRKTESMAAKNADKQRSGIDKSYKSVTFDLQKVLQIPSSEVSLMYYLRKLNMYNLTIYESSLPNDAFCYVWTEINGKRGSCEIGSCLFQYLQQLGPEITEISLYSDTCGGQNRNVQISALLLHAVQTMHFEVIEHKFLESGHTFMEVDSMHSSIENSKKYVDVFSVHEWINVMKKARISKKNPYTVREMNFTDFSDLKFLSKNLIKNKSIDENGDTVNWLKVKCFKYQKSSENTIFYRYDHTSPYKKINTQLKKRQKTSSIAIETIPRLYNSRLPISVEKKKDLLMMCKKNIIPIELHGWYESLPSSTKVPNTNPEPSIQDSDEES